MYLCSCVLCSPEGEEAEAAEGAREAGFGAVGLKKLTVFVKKPWNLFQKAHSRVIFLQKNNYY
jgi:hypothetical protein